MYAANGGTVGPDGKPQFTQEQVEQMMKDPNFAQMFGGNSPFGNSGNAFTSSNDVTVDAEFTEK